MRHVAAQGDSDEVTAFFETLRDSFQQTEAAAVTILAEAAPFTWIMMPVFPKYL